MGRNSKPRKKKSGPRKPVETKIPKVFSEPKVTAPKKKFITEAPEEPIEETGSMDKKQVVSSPELNIGRDNFDFVQLSRGYLKAWRELSISQPLAAGVLMYLVENMGRTTNAVICSYKTLQEVTGYSRPSIARAIKVLKEGNWIDTVKIGSATAYCVNERVAWQAARNQRKYAIFSATVVASESEQEQDYLERVKHDLKYIPVIRSGEQAVVSSEDLPPPDQKDLY